MSEEIYKRARLARMFKSPKVGVRGAKKSKPESFMSTREVRSARGLEGRPAERARASQIRTDMSRKPPRYV